MSELSPILQVAKDILSEARKPLHVNEIAAEAVRTNRNMQLPADEFSKRVASALAANLRTKSPSFGKIKGKTPGSFKKGVYRVCAPRGNKLPPPPPPEPVSSNFLGKAGEHAVMAELLHRGFNASLMAVDEGIDLVASRNNEYFHIQVKTSALGANGKYSFFIKNNAFLANNGGKTYYIFVMRSTENRNIFAVFPSSQLVIDRDSGMIGGASGISITITPDARHRSFAMNKGKSIDQFINNFGIIK